MSRFERKLVNSIAVIVPRYGPQLGGGAEALVKAIIEELAVPDEQGERLVDCAEVWTTCAKDHRTWANELPTGLTFERGIPVRRFPVDSRDIDCFLRMELAIGEGRPLLVDEQLAWLENSVNSRALYEHIIKFGQDFDVLIFAPYLFATTFWGALIYPERSLIIPCLHNENYAYQSVFHHLFGQVRGIICNSAPELDLMRELYQKSDFEERAAVVGMGFVDSRLASSSEGESQVVHSAKAPLPSRVRHPFLLYSGRKERGKNLDLLVSYFAEMASAADSPKLQLVLIGAGDLNLAAAIPDRVIDLGFVSEEEKEVLMQQALALVQPSTNESFSIVLMEAWLRETPVIVHGQCAVTRDHVVRSGGGCYFSDAGELKQVVRELLANPTLRTQLGSAGNRYVRDCYCWPAVLGRLYRAFDKFGIHYGARSESKISQEPVETAFD